MYATSKYRAEIGIKKERNQSHLKLARRGIESPDLLFVVTAAARLHTGILNVRAEIKEA